MEIDDLIEAEILEIMAKSEEEEGAGDALNGDSSNEEVEERS